MEAASYDGFGRRRRPSPGVPQLDCRARTLRKRSEGMRHPTRLVGAVNYAVCVIRT
jgi:hypothetical protein